MSVDKKYKDFKSFYPYYLAEHSDRKNRILHFAGTLILLILLVAGIVTGKWWMFVLIPVAGYGFAWAGHYFIEKNKPATFSYPFYSLAGDFLMFWQMLTGEINLKNKNLKNN